MQPEDKTEFETWFVRAYPAQYFSEWTSKIRSAEAVYRFGQAVLTICKLAYSAGLAAQRKSHEN